MTTVRVRANLAPSRLCIERQNRCGTRLTWGIIMRMRTIARSADLEALLERLGRLTPDSGRRWGTMTPSEMLCHLGDAAEMALRIRPRQKPFPARGRPIVKLFGLWTPVRWPHGWPTNASQDPRRSGTRPSQFAADLQRVMNATRALAASDGTSLEPVHGLFGTMTLADWHRWAWKHTDHHLRQFGL